MLTTYTYSVSIERMRWKRGEEMKVSRKDIRWAVSEGVISEGQAEDLWLALQRRNVDRPRFDLPHVAYYFGALVVISAMTWFMTLGWERFGGGGMLLISLSYALAFAVAGGLLWRERGLKVPGGLLVTAAVCMTPLAVYGFETMTGAWLQGAPGDYGDFYDYIKGGWFPMEVATVVAGLVALRFFRFPFLTAPIAFALWFMSMDLTPLIYGEHYYEAQGYQVVSLVFGLAVLVGAYIVDRRTEEDYAFWGYLFGMFAFWGGLTLLEGGSELDWFFYGLINAGLVVLSVLLQRRVLVVFGALGVFGYVGHLAWEIFEDSLLFPFALSAAGLAIIALGILYARNRGKIEDAMVRAIPTSIRCALPMERGAR
jgi:hypothetical protein